MSESETRNPKPEIRRLAILGSTGSIGTQALDVVAAHPGHFEVEVLAAGNNAELLVAQAKKFRPNVVVINDTAKLAFVKEALHDDDIKVYGGEEALCDVVQMETIDLVLAGIVGYAGLRSTLAAVKAGKQIALANKETLVVAGEIVTAEARKNGVNLYPVDSEHSAIFQCLAGEFHNPIEKIYLTASGGPFRGKKRDELLHVTKKDALKHPNWEMGAKITIDSATLMNKGLEVIEAKWLFGLKPEQIDVIVHPQSIIHSIVQFCDGSMKAQMGLPDMKLPIQYALGYPQRLRSDFPRFNFMNYPSLTFEKPDTETFPCLQLAMDALKKGGNMPCVMNAANEVAVQAFLGEKISFLQIAEVISGTMAQSHFLAKPSYEDYVKSDEEARRVAVHFAK
ncbi:MAG TPA: 1-deoxy-D-xylulose-5-phosphate reductoisomerase [Bacteroidia bacterium]|nr:1-deoxy-D-xylulose-5-phosphate reductoisomerase [Bacteroidia bacterium]